jgi:hypothetical protein
MEPTNGTGGARGEHERGVALRYRHVTLFTVPACPPAVWPDRAACGSRDSAAECDLQGYKDQAFAVLMARLMSLISGVVHRHWYAMTAELQDRALATTENEHLRMPGRA